MNINEAIAWGRKTLCKHKRAGLESEILLSFVLNTTREYLHTWGEKEISQEDYANFQSLVKRRQNAQPIEYLTNKASFYSQTFYVDSKVLIPRVETEILIDKAIALIKKNAIKNIAEIGIGSGIISIILALQCPDIHITATDISKDSLEVASKNIAHFHTKQNTLKERIKLVHTNLLDSVHQDFEFLLSNPPYIANHYPLDRVVLQEPHCALFGGERGDEILQEIIKLANQKKIAFLACEMGYDQKEFLSKTLEALHFKANFYQDLAGLDRGFVAQRISFS